MTENERVKELRKARGLTLEQFGTRLGIGRSTISAIEKGQRALTRQNLLSICREFGVREEWLRTGEGEMTQQTGTVSLDDLVKQSGLTGQDADMVKKLVQVFCSLKADTRKEILSRFDEYFRGNQDEIPSAMQEQEFDEDIESEVAEYRKERYKEKEENRQAGITGRRGVG